jgi:hypothetical protein
MNYDNMTDEELIRFADGQSGLIKVLSERLEMRLRDMEDLAYTMPDPTPDPKQLNLFEDDNA